MGLPHRRGCLTETGDSRSDMPMRYRVIDPRPVSFAAGLRPSDPMRSEGRTPFEGHAQPHQSLRWILVAVPTGDLAPDEFRLDSGVWLRISWDEYNGDKSQRGVVASMAEVLRGGGRLPPVLVVDRGRPLPELIDGYHRVAAARTSGRPEVDSYLLVA
jgi:hypothetical protein